MKGLEALKQIKIANYYEDDEYADDDYLGIRKEIKIIEQELKDYEELKKVLDILKSKIKFEINDKSLFGFKQNNLVVNKDIFGSVSLTQEEYDLLKGWLNNGTK